MVGPAAVVLVELAGVLALHRFVLGLRDRRDREVERPRDLDLVDRRLVFAMAGLVVGEPMRNVPAVTRTKVMPIEFLTSRMCPAGGGARPAAAGQRLAAGGACRQRRGAAPAAASAS